MTQIGAFLILFAINAIAEGVPLGDAWEALCDAGGGEFVRVGVDYECQVEWTEPPTRPAR